MNKFPADQTAVDGYTVARMNAHSLCAVCPQIDAGQNHISISGFNVQSLPMAPKRSAADSDLRGIIMLLFRLSAAPHHDAAVGEIHIAAAQPAERAAIIVGQTDRFLKQKAD